MNNQTNLMLQMEKSKMLDIHSMGKSQIHILFSQAHIIVDYQTSIFEFYKKIQDQFFPAVNEQGTKKEAKRNAAGGRSNIKNMTYDLNSRNMQNDSFFVGQNSN